VHELAKLDRFLGVADGTSYEVIVRHCRPDLLNPHLARYGIRLDQDGMLPKEQRPAWKALMQEAGVSQRYWKDPDLLIEDRPIATL
jgi:hypothetical protein